MDFQTTRRDSVLNGLVVWVLDSSTRFKTSERVKSKYSAVIDFKFNAFE